MEEFSELKSARLLSIYARLLNGRVLKKALLAQEFGVTARSIQRDLSRKRMMAAVKNAERNAPPAATMTSTDPVSTLSNAFDGKTSCEA